MKTLRKRIFGILTGLILAAAFVELALRMLPVCFMPASENANDEFLAKKITPNQSGIYTKGWLFQMGAKLETNSDGFISAKEYLPFDSSENSTTIIGDSLIELMMVEENGRFAATLEREAAARGAKLNAYNLGINGAGLADFYKAAQLAVKKFGSKTVIIKIAYNDILDNAKRADGHFYYAAKGDGKYEIKLVPKNETYSKLKDIAAVRYIFVNLQIRPNGIKSKLKNAFGLKADADKIEVKNLSADEKLLLQNFLDDISKLFSGDTSKVLFISNETCGADKDIESLLKKNNFDFVSVKNAHKDASKLNMYHFYNDTHWNANGVKKIVEEIIKTDFAKKNILSK